MADLSEGPAEVEQAGESSVIDVLLGGGGSFDVAEYHRKRKHADKEAKGIPEHALPHLRFEVVACVSCQRCC